MDYAGEARLVAGIFGFAWWLGNDYPVSIASVCVDPLTADETEAAAREPSFLASLGDLDPLRVAHDLVDCH